MPTYSEKLLLDGAKNGDIVSITHALCRIYIWTGYSARDEEVKRGEAETGETALHIAVKYNQIKAIEHIIRCDASINARNISGKSSFDLAREKGGEVYKTLVECAIKCVGPHGREETVNNVKGVERFACHLDRDQPHPAGEPSIADLRKAQDEIRAEETGLGSARTVRPRR